MGSSVFALSGSLQPLELRLTLGKSFLFFNLLYPSSFPLPRLFLGSAYQAAVTLITHIALPVSMRCLESLTCMD